MTTEEVQRFVKGELVLCYEPNMEKARVLYEAKILAECTPRDKTDKRPEYKVHFPGWSRSWDRRVKADTLLKNNEENRKLMNELAAAAKLQRSNNYSYKVSGSTASTPKRKSEKRSHIIGSGSTEFETSVNSNEQMGSSRVRDSSAGSGKSDRQSGGSAIREGGAKRTRTSGNIKLNKDNDHQHDLNIEQGLRVKLNPSPRLRKYLEFDNNMIVNCGAQHVLPADTSIIDILEDFVKLRSVELAIQSAVELNRGSRHRSTTQIKEKIDRENDRVICTVNLLKEVADGVRIYFLFLLKECLLYEQECKYMERYISTEFLSKVQRKPSTSTTIKSSNSGKAKSTNSLKIDVTDKLEITADSTTFVKYGSAAYKKQLHQYLTIIDKKSLSKASPYGAAETVSEDIHTYLDEVFNWQILPDDVEPEVSMVFGATHLARLLVKLPDYLSASPIPDDKLKVLITHLDSLMNYMESHEEWFNEKNYIVSNMTQYAKAVNSKIRIVGSNSNC